MSEQNAVDMEYETVTPPSIEATYVEPAIFVNWMNVHAFADDTVRVTFAESATASSHAVRGAFRMTLDNAHCLSEMLGNAVALAVEQRQVKAEARRKMI